MSSPQAPFFVAGGALPLSVPSYVQRRADIDLYRWLNEGHFCYVLTSRQMGKTSLMVRTATRLRNEKVAVAVLDLSSIGLKNINAEQWYDGLLLRVGKHLGLQQELKEFWEAQDRLGPMDRLMQAIQEVVLKHIKGRVVIFVDEIDGVRTLPFSTDEFFAGIRSFYNERARSPELERLSFCLIGVATPSDLIQDVRTTPFNIGQRIDLNDFTEDEAAPLAAGLNSSAGVGQILLKRVLYWTGGHPYLTQRLCTAVAEEPQVTSAKDVDRVCEETFLSSRAREQDSNLIFVRDRILRADADQASLLDLYEQIYDGKRVLYDDTNPLIDVLRISGITRAVDGYLRVRNRIYERVFNKNWIKASMPDAELRRQKAAFLRGILRAAAIAAVILSIVGILAASFFSQRQEARRQQQIAVRERQVAEDQRKLANENEIKAIRASEDAEKAAKKAEEALEIAKEEKGRADQKAEEARVALAHAEAEKRRADTQFELARRSAEQARTELKQRINQLSAIYEERGRLEAIRGDNWNALPFLSEAASLNDTLSRSYGEQQDSGTLSFLLARAISPVETEKVSLKGHASLVGLADFSPDARYLVTAGADGTAKVWEAGSGRLLRSLNKHTDAITSVAFSADNKHIVTSSLDYTAIIWDISDGSSLTLHGHSGPVTSASFSPQGNLVVTTSFDGDARIWDAGSGKQLQRLNAHQGEVHSAAWSQDGTRVVTAGVDKTAKTWDVGKGTILQVLGGKEGHEKQIIAVRFNPRDSTIFTVSVDATVKQWDEKTGSLLQTFKDTTAIKSINFSPDGKRMVTAGGDATAKVWNIADARIISELKGHTGNVNSAVFHPDGAMVLTASQDNSAKIWDAASGDLLMSLNGHAGEVTFATFSPDGEQVVTTSTDNTAKIWDVGGGRLPRSLVHEGQLEAVALSPDDTRIVTTGRDSVAILWDLRTGKPVAPPLRHGDEWVLRAAFSRDGSKLLTVSKSQTKIWSAVDGRALHTLGDSAEQAKPILKSLGLEPSPGKFIIKTLDAAFSPDNEGRYVVSTHMIADHEGYIRGYYWVERETLTGEPIAQSSSSDYSIRKVVFHPAGRMIFTVGNGRAALWRAWNGIPLTFFTGVSCAALSPDGRRIVLGDDDAIASVWSMVDNRIRRLEGHADKILSVAFSADGKRFVTTSADRTAKLWDTESGSLISTLSGHNGSVLSAAFNREGNLIVTSSSDKTAKVWEAETGRLLTTLEGHADEVRYALFSNDGTRVVTASRDHTAKLWDMHLEQRTAAEIASIVDNRIPYNVQQWRLFNPQRRGGAGQDDDGAGGSLLSTGVSTSSPTDLRRARLLEEEGRQNLLDQNWNWAALRLAESYQLGARGAAGSYLLGRAARQFEALEASLHAHTDKIWHVLYSPDGRTILTVSIDKTAKLWDVETRRLRATLVGHTDWIFRARFSPDSKLAVTASRDGTAKIWDVASGKLLHTLAHQKQVTSAIFNAQGNLVATASDDGAVGLWNALTGQQVRSFGPHSSGVLFIAFSPDGERLISGCRDGVVKLWNTANGQEVAPLEKHEGNISVVAFDPSGQRVVSAGDDGMVKLRDARSGAPVRQFEHGVPVSSVAFSRDGQRILIGCDDGTVELWNRADKEPLKLKEHWGAVVSVAFSRDERVIITSSYDRTAKLWDAQTGKLFASFEGHGDESTDAALSPDGKQVATVSGETLRLWKAQPTMLDSRQLDLHGTVLATATEERSGRLLALVSRQGLLKVADASTGGDVASIKVVSSYLVGTEIAGINSLAILPFSHAGDNSGGAQQPDGGKLAEALIGSLSGQAGLRLQPYEAVKRYQDTQVSAQTVGRELGVEAVLTGRIEPIKEERAGDFSITIELFSMRENKSLSKTYNVYRAELPTLHEEIARYILGTGREPVAFMSRNGSYVITGEANGRAKVWDATNGRLIVSFKELPFAISHVTMSDDGKLAAVVSDNDRIVIFEAMTGKELRTLRPDCSNSVVYAEFSPDGALLATSGLDDTARVCRVADGELVASLQGHKGSVLTARFNHDGTRLVTTSTDKTAKIWDVRGSLLLASLDNHGGSVNAADFSPDDSFVITGGGNSITYLWDAQTGRLLDRFRRNDGAVQLTRFLPDGKQALSVNESGMLRVWRIASADAQLAQQISLQVKRFILPALGRGALARVDGADAPNRPDGNTQTR